MKPVPTLTIPAVILWLLAPAYSASRGNAGSPASKAETTLEQIDGLSARLAEQAYNLDVLAQRMLAPESHLEGLDLMKSDINRIGKDLSRLEAQRESLAPWETKALGQILPLMSDAAVKAQ